MASIRERVVRQTVFGGQQILGLLVHYHLTPLLEQPLPRVCTEMLTIFCKELLIKQREQQDRSKCLDFLGGKIKTFVG